MPSVDFQHMTGTATAVISEGPVWNFEESEYQPQCNANELKKNGVQFFACRSRSAFMMFSMLRCKITINNDADEQFSKISYAKRLLIDL